MKGVYFDLKPWKVILKFLHLGSKYSMILVRDDWPEPQIKYPNQVKLKTKICGFCASDLHMIQIKISYFASILASKENPFPMGHEIVASVEEIGSEVTSLKKGDRVIMNTIGHCSTYGFKPCSGCQSGNWSQCYCLVGMGDGSELESKYGGRGNFGGHFEGGFCEYLLANEKQLYKIPANLPDDIAVLAEPFACTIHAVARNMPKDSDAVLVVGAGTLGLLTIAALRGLGSNCRIITLAKYDHQAEFAKRLGSNEIIIERDRKTLFRKIAEMTNGKLFKPTLGIEYLFGGSGPDVIFDCIATEKTIDDDIHLVRSNGKIIFVGLGSTTTKKVDWSVQAYKEISLTGAMMYGIENINGEKKDDFELALEMLSKEPDKFKGFVTHKFPIDQFKYVMNLMEKKGKIKGIKLAFEFK